MATNDAVDLLKAEIEELSDTIFLTLSEVATLRHPMMDDDRVLAAVDELDAIVAATEVATDDILTATEALDALGADLAKGEVGGEAAAEAISRQTTAIYQASNFQDITGQRIAKVMGLLRDIDVRVMAMIQLLSRQTDMASLPLPPKREGDAALVNGPQTAQNALVQNDIDSLFD
ncbi:MAG: protein phosphatase CheZ [Pseudomonadota bacterium]